MIDVETFKQIVKDNYIDVTYGPNVSESGKFLRIECNCVVLELENGEQKYIVISSIIDFQKILPPPTAKEIAERDRNSKVNASKNPPKATDYIG